MMYFRKKPFPDIRTMFRNMICIMYRNVGIKLVLLVCFMCSPFPSFYVQSESFREFQVKAVFLYNLTNFISWPDDAFYSDVAPFRIGIVGKDPFGPFLDKVVQGEIVNGRHIVIERFHGIEDLRTCHILFISSSMKAELPEILKVTRNFSTLTVSDFQGFAHLGGVVNLVRKENRVCVEINPISARRAGLGISAKLLKLATIIREEFTWEDD
ncbi:MAG: YfiR family protein [Thermodesulfobacteriota bacterium]|nr:YfiR family protein [Thermodesulfobacteriota bacterium]